MKPHQRTKLWVTPFNNRRRIGETGKGGRGMGRSGPGIAGGYHEVREMDCRRMAPGPLDLRFQAPWAEKRPKVAMTIIFLSRDYSLTPIRILSQVGLWTV